MQRVFLKDLLACTKDGEWGKSESFEDSIEMLVLRSTDLDKLSTNNNGELPRRFIKTQIAKRKTLQTRDIILETAGGGKDRPTGRSFKIPKKLFHESDLPITCASFCRFLRIDPQKAYPEFIYWKLQQLYNAGSMHQYHTQHTGVARFQYTDFASNLLFNLPSYGEQIETASILDAYDDLIENNLRRILIHEKMVRSIYNEWFVKLRFLGYQKVRMVNSSIGPIPNNWEIMRFDQIGYISRGRSRHRPRNEASLYGGPYPFFQTGDIKSAKLFLVHPTQFYSEEGLAQSKMWDAGTLCITIAANIAETAILGIRGCFPDSVVGFIPDSKYCNVYYVKLYIDTIKTSMQSASRGTTQDNLSVEKLLSFACPIPPLGIMSNFEHMVKPLFDQILVLQKSIQKLVNTRDLLLPRLMTGDISLSNPVMAKV